MNISRENIDELNAIVKVAIAKEDYEPQVTKILKNYRKNANIPGFRKGHVPMGLVKKQYGQAVLVDEVNKLLQDSLNKYLTEEKLNVLGNPLPKEQDDFTWDKENFTFEFELGLAPDFEVNIKTEEAIPSYKIVADEKMIDNQIEHIRTQYGKLVTKQAVEEGDRIVGIFHNEEKEIDNRSTFSIDQIKDEESRKKLMGAKPQDRIELSTKGLFEDEQTLAGHLGIDSETAKELDTKVNLEIVEINHQELAELNEELFKKVFGEEAAIKTEEEFRTKIKEDTEEQFVGQTDQQLLNDVSEALIEKTDFELPDEFLKKWIRVSGEKQLSEEEAKEEYQRSEKGLRYQLIENKLLQDHDIKVEFEEVKSSAKERIKMQMAQFGQLDPKDEDLEDIAKRVLSNETEARNFSEQVKNEKLIQFFKENANLEPKEVTYEEFIEKIMG